MVGEEYFRKRLVDIYDYSLMKYECGSGNLELGGVSYEVTWEAAISVSADLILVLSVPSLPEFDSSRLKEFGTLTGQTHDKRWQIKATGVLITNISFSSEGRLDTRLTCRARQFDVTRGNAAGFSTSHIEGQLLNFDFLGLEVTKTPNGQVMDKFSA